MKFAALISVYVSGATTRVILASLALSVATTPEQSAIRGLMTAASALLASFSTPSGVLAR